MFEIRALGSTDPVTGRPLARIVLGDEEEQFPLFSDIWTVQKFEQQWMTTLQRLVDSEKDSIGALLTEIYRPSTNTAVRCWALYLKGSTVWVREQLVSRDDLPASFDPNLAESYVLPRAPSDDPRFEVSEWKINRDDVREFLRHKRTQHT